MNSNHIRFIENILAALVLIVLLLVFTDASSSVLSIVAGFFAGKIFADIFLMYMTNTSDKEGEYPQKKQTHKSENSITSCMSGKILKSYVIPGAHVKKGEILFVIESCKLETEITSPKDGLVSEVFAAEGDTVAKGDILILFY